METDREISEAVYSPGHCRRDRSSSQSYTKLRLIDTVIIATTIGA